MTTLEFPSLRDEIEYAVRYALDLDSLKVALLILDRCGDDGGHGIQLLAEAINERERRQPELARGANTARGTITLTGEEYDALVRKVRCRALEDAHWQVMHDLDGDETIAPAPQRCDGGASERTARRIAARIRAQIEREKKP